MIQITRITYIHHDGSVKINRPEHLEVATKIQMEKLRRIIKTDNDCKDVNFTYEEH